MTDLERDASEIVRDIIDACAQAEGYADLLEATDWSVNQSPFKDRIVALSKRYAQEYEHMPRVGGREWMMAQPGVPSVPRTFPPL